MAQEFNQSVKLQEKVKPQKDESVRIEFTVSKEESEILEQVKAMMSHQNPENSWKELVMLLAKKELKRRVGKGKEIEKEQTCAQVDTKAEPSSEIQIGGKTTDQAQNFLQYAATSLRSSKRKYISVHLKRDLLRKARYQCEFIDPQTHKRCSQKHFLECEHKMPLAKGGNNNPENLRIYCRSHNAHAAKEWGL